MLQQVENPHLLFERRIAERETHQEAIELGLGQRKRPLVVDRVLGGDYQEGRVQRMRHSVDRHPAFRHGFQERRLRPRRRAVDFVGQGRSGQKPDRGETRTPTSSG